MKEMHLSLESRKTYFFQRRLPISDPRISRTRERPILELKLRPMDFSVLSRTDYRCLPEPLLFYFASMAAVFSSSLASSNSYQGTTH